MRDARLRVAFCALALLVTAACAPAAGPAPPPSTAPPAVAQPAPTTAPTAAPIAAPTAAATRPAATAAAAKPAETGTPSQALIDAAKAEGKLILYASISGPLLDLMTGEFNKKYGIKVDVTRKAGAEIMQTVDAERRVGKVRADLLSHGDEAQVATWVEQGLLMKYQPESARFLAPELRDPGGTWVPQFLTLCPIGYNAQKVKKEDLPRTYKELADPKWRGRLVSVRPRGSGTGSVFVNVLSNTLGWSYFEELARNQPLLLSSVSALPAVVINGEADIAMPLLEHIAGPLVAKGEPLALVYPTDVIPVGASVIAASKDATSPNAAKLFMDFTLTTEFQALMAKETGARGTNVNAPPPAGAPPLRDLKVKRADVDWMTKHIAEQDDRFDSIFLGTKAK